MMLMWFSSRLPAFMRSRADPPPRYSMMIHSLVPCNTGVREEQGQEQEPAGSRSCNILAWHWEKEGQEEPGRAGGT